MYLRLRKLIKEDIQPGEEVLMMAEQGPKIEGRLAILMKPVQLEWWDGIDWHPVRFVEATDETEPV